MRPKSGEKGRCSKNSSFKFLNFPIAKTPLRAGSLFHRSHDFFHLACQEELHCIYQ